ncbi:glutathione S-transferase 1-like [Periplaneta americana]|uniref:glutathione S-transferase 1-like n=1 Tax=Periplaneta americana TaxID=6978 RepID=UPI0037E95A23
MPVHLYHFEGSPPCHSVRLLAKTLDLDLNLIYVDYLKGENMDQKFGQKNPLHTVPTIDDDGFMVAESRVILGYLAEKYDESGSLYPKDLQKRTIVNQRLYFDLGTLYQSYREYYGEVFRTGRLGEPARLAKVEKAFQVLNRYLEQNAWVAGDDLTIADFTVVSSVAAIDVNPLHRVPVIDDNGFIVGESRAILGYFMDQYAKDDSLYPKDAKQRTIINQRLYFDMGTLYQPFYDYYCHVFIDGKLGDPSILRKLEEAFQVLDKYLNGQDWVAGSNISIADYAILASVSNVESIGFDISKYPNVVKWHKKAQKAIPGYDEIVVPGSALLNHYYNKVKKC